MSSPLSSLQKTKKTPFHRPPPYRNVNDIESIIKSDFEHNYSPTAMEEIPTDCEDLMDDVMYSSHHKIKVDSTSQSKNSTSKIKHGPDDFELMSSMMGRISQLQLRVQFLEKEVAEKNKEIKMLKLRNSEKVHSNHGKDVPQSKLTALERENKKLRKQVYDMEEFLADYGMMWAGNSDSDDEKEPLSSSTLNTSRSLWEPGQSVASEFHPDYDAIMKNIRDLNILAGEGETKILRNAAGAELRRPDPVNLSLYANGIIMFDGPFRPFTDTVTKQCVLDLQDGFFPTELQKRYPDGVIFSVHDNRHLHYEQKSSKAFEGQGQTLGGEIKPSRLVPSNLDKNIQTTSKSHVRNVPSAKFLDRLPSNVVNEHGKVIDIRQAVSDMIQGEDSGKSPRIPDSISLVNTSVVDTLRKSARGERTLNDVDDEHCSTLRIKHADRTYVLVMKYSETVGDIRKHLSEHSKSLSGVKYDLITSYPRKIYSDNSVTLQQAGLVPNAMMHLQIKK